MSIFSWNPRRSPSRNSCKASSNPIRSFSIVAIGRATVGGNAVGGEFREVVYTITPETLKGYLCRPSGAGPFPAVAYNHGGLGDIIGGAPKETFAGPTAGGFSGFSPH